MNVRENVAQTDIQLKGFKPWFLSPEFEIGTCFAGKLPSSYAGYKKIKLKIVVLSTFITTSVLVFYLHCHTILRNSLSFIFIWCYATLSNSSFLTSFLVLLINVTILPTLHILTCLFCLVVCFLFLLLRFFFSFLCFYYLAQNIQRNSSRIILQNYSLA